MCPTGSDLSARNRDQLQPLHSAILGRHCGTVGMLLRRGAVSRASALELQPHLGWAARGRYAYVVARLMRADLVLMRRCSHCFAGPAGRLP